MISQVGLHPNVPVIRRRESSGGRLRYGSSEDGIRFRVDIFGLTVRFFGVCGF